MSHAGLTVLWVVLIAGATVFFSVNLFALRQFSPSKLIEAFSLRNLKGKADKLMQISDKLVITCSFYRLILNTCIPLILIRSFAISGDGQLNPAGYIIIFIASVLVIFLFSLAIPFAWAKYTGEILLSYTYPLLIFFAVTAAPVYFIFRLYDTLIRRLAGITEITPEEDREERQEEFLTNLEQHRRQGVVDEEEQEMIENVLELSDTTADEIMTPRTDIVAVDVDMGLASVLDTITKAGHSRVPVYEETIDNIIGFIYAKDLLAEVGNNIGEFKLRDKLRQAYFVPEAKPLRALLHEFQNQKLHIAVVLDEYGGTAGIVTLEDILEELVGEIVDEYEKTPPKPIRKLTENSFQIDARMYIDDLNDQLDLDIPESEDYDTLGGFIFSYLGHIPKTGIRFDHEGLEFTILSAESRRIKTVKIQKTSEKKNAE